MKHPFTLLLLAFISISLSHCKKAVVEEPLKVSADFIHFSDNDYYAPSVLTFTSKSENAITYEWVFGNGKVSNLSNPNVEYPAPGIYTVRLVVRNENSVNEFSETSQEIEIRDPRTDKKKLLFFTDNSLKSKLQNADVNGDLLPVYDMALQTPSGVAVDIDRGAIYVADKTTGQSRILKYTLGGDSPVTFLDQTSELLVDEPVALTFVSGNLVWSKKEAIVRSSPDGSSVSVLVDLQGSSCKSPVGIAYDESNDVFYIANDIASGGGLWAVNYSGGGLIELIYSIDVTAVSFHQTGEKIYYAVRNEGVFRCDRSGMNIERIADVGSFATTALIVNNEDEKLYWGVRNSENGKDGIMMQANLDGTQAEIWLSDVNPIAVALDTYRK